MKYQPHDTSYPLVNTRDSKQRFICRSPKFNNTVGWDPNVTVNNVEEFTTATPTATETTAEGAVPATSKQSRRHPLGRPFSLV